MLVSSYSRKAGVILTVWDVGKQGEDNKCPDQGVRQRLLKLVPLEMLISNALLVHPNTLDSHQTLMFRQEARIELTVRHVPYKQCTHQGCKQAKHEEDQLPPLNRERMSLGTNSNTVRDNPADNLAPPVETEPPSHSSTLFGFRVPLASEQNESGAHGGFGSTEEEPYSKGPGQILIDTSASATLRGTGMPMLHEQQP
jgi:hypothetical protein